MMPDTDSKINQIIDLIADGRQLPDENKKRIEKFASELKKIYGFSVIKDPADGYDLFVRFWRTALVFKSSGEIKSTNLMYFKKPDLFFDIANGRNERKAVFDETKYDAPSVSATVVNPSIPNILVGKMNKRSMQDYFGSSFNKNQIEIIRDISLLANSLLEPSDMTSEIFEEGHYMGEMLSDRDFTKKAKTRISEILSTEIELWSSFIHDMESSILSPEICEIMRKASISNIATYNWLNATDIKDGSRAIIKENRQKFANEWPMLLSMMVSNYNTFDKYYQAVNKGESIENYILEESSCSVEILEKMKNLDASAMGYSNDIGKTGFYELLDSLKNTPIESIPETPQDWKKFYATQEWLKSCNRMMTDRNQRSIPVVGSPNFDYDKLIEASKLLPMVAEDIGSYINGVPSACIFQFEGSQERGTMTNAEAGLLVILNDKNIDEIVDFILDYYPNIIDMHNNYTLASRFSENDTLNRNAQRSCIWKGFSSNKYIRLPSGYKINIEDSMYDIHKIEEKGNIPFTPLAFFAYFDSGSNQYISIQNSAGEYIGALKLNMLEMQKVSNMTNDDNIKFWYTASFSELPSYVTDVVTQNSMTPTTELLEAIWDFDTELRSKTIPVNYAIVGTETELRKTMMKEKKYQTIAWHLDRNKLWSTTFDIIKKYDILPYVDLDKGNVLASFRNIKEYLSIIKDTPFIEPIYENNEKNKATPSKPSFKPRLIGS